MGTQHAALSVARRALLLACVVALLSLGCSRAYRNPALARAGRWLTSRAISSELATAPCSVLGVVGSGVRLCSSKEGKSGDSAAVGASLDSLIADTLSYEQDALNCLREAADSKEVEVFRVAFLGKNGKITNMMKEMKVLSKEDKPKLGEVVNRAKVAVEAAIEEAKISVTSRELDALLAREDLGNMVSMEGMPHFYPDPGHRHPLGLVLDLTTRIFEEIGYECVSDADDSPEIENDFFNFEALGMPPSHPARDMQDTFYIDTTGMGTNETLLLRTHTSAVQIREMEKRTPPFKIVVPGRVYRKDDVDATHYPMFHQVEILAIDEIGKLTIEHLLGTVSYFLKTMFGSGIELKYRASYFPFTEPSVEVDVFFRGRWLEVMGCGMVDPLVLQSVGYDPEKYSGFAAGFGIERFAMIMHNITDIRLFWENRMEFLSQFPSQSYGIPGDDEEERLRDAASGAALTEEDIRNAYP